jgi:cell division septation protein DedD
MAKEQRTGYGLFDWLGFFALWAATCGVVYLLGFYTGKGTQESQLGHEERLVRLPVASTPPPAGQRPKSENELTFYDTLVGEKPSGEGKLVPAKEMPAVDMSPAVKPVALPPASPGSRPVVPVVAGKPAAVPPLVTPTTHPPLPGAVSVAPPPATAPLPAVSAAAPPPPPPTNRPAGGLAPIPPAALPSLASGTPAGQVVAERPPATAAVTTGADSGMGGWTVQANPTRSREEADELVRRLRARGYQATAVRMLRDGDTWYRVRVGRYMTSQEATVVMQRLREQEGVSHAFVASE